ncbi:MAG: Gfo/Idh/MocA family oxidoreductase [Atopobiaceae bacterium]|nr:Gfo/Idh/MocA family oxidoreductase [Atopobiaceae bacterium]MBR1829982.1 Gfo/Idh/MocA family oxidoreductase [Atopobiaceae bacterium]
MIRFGILGAGNIAHRFAASLAFEEDAKLVAISCRSAEKAAAWVSDYGISANQAYAGDNAHEDLLSDPEVDAIYLALPHQLHYQWTLAALRAGKAVLCEKPAMLTAQEMAEVADVAREQSVLFMEAMKPRFVALYQQVIDAMSEIGKIVRIDATLCNDMLGYAQGKDSYHLHGGPGAGVLLDCGIYCASWLEDFCPGIPRLDRICGAFTDGVDTYVDATLEYGGIEARLECAFDRAKPRTATIVGTKGSILVEELHRPQRAIVTLADGSERIIDAPYEHDDFYGEVHHFCELLRAGATESPIMPLKDSLHCALLLDTIREGFHITRGALDTLAEQERILRYPERFGAEEALALGNRVATLFHEYDRGVTVKITRESDGMQLFAWSNDDKAPRNYGFVEGKRAAALESGHASIWRQLELSIAGHSDELFSTPDAFPVAGAFPIRVMGSDEIVATIVVSGLHEGLDHELVVRALETELGVHVPALKFIIS